MAGSPADMPSVLARVAEDEATVDHLAQHGRELDENATLARADAQAMGELAGAGVGDDVLALALDAHNFHFLVSAPMPTG